MGRAHAVCLDEREHRGGARVEDLASEPLRRRAVGGQVGDEPLVAGDEGGRRRERADGRDLVPEVRVRVGDALVHLELGLQMGGRLHVTRYI